jgi:hypothetical protein
MPHIPPASRRDCPQYRDEKTKRRNRQARQMNLRAFALRRQPFGIARFNLVFCIHDILRFSRKWTRLRRMISGDAFGPRRRFTLSRDFSRSRFSTCWLMHEKHCATSVPSNTGSLAKITFGGANGSKRVFNGGFAGIFGIGSGLATAIPAGDANTPFGNINSEISRNSAVSLLFALRFRSHNPINSNRLCRNTRTSRRPECSVRMSKAHRNFPSSISAKTSFAVRSRNMDTAGKGTSGRRADIPKSNGFGTGGKISARSPSRREVLELIVSGEVFMLVEWFKLIKYQQNGYLMLANCVSTSILKQSCTFIAYESI